jgi:hypothetical protein
MTSTFPPTLTRVLPQLRVVVLSLRYMKSTTDWTAASDLDLRAPDLRSSVEPQVSRQ